jgi:hypothetical protein
MPLEWLSTIIYVLTMHSTLDGSWITYICMLLKSYLETTPHPWQQENWVASICICCKWDLQTTSTLHMRQESWVASICMWCKSNLKIVWTPHGNKNVGYIHLYVVQIKPKNCMNTPWQQECGLHPLVCGVNQT